MPQACVGGTMATLPFGNEPRNGAVLIGCNDGNKNGLEKIFKITWQGDHLVWETLTQQLKYPRNQAIAMNIPETLTHCTSLSKVYHYEQYVMNLAEPIKTTSIRPIIE